MTLDLMTAPARHPNIHHSLLYVYIPAAIVRLGVDPVRLPEGTMQRELKISHLAFPGQTEPVEITETLTWDLNDPIVERLFLERRDAMGDTEITSQAAIAVMALLANHLEGVIVNTVLQIGSGGDYLVEIEPRVRRLQLEVSGVEADHDGRDTAKRIRQKTRQVLKKANEGFVSVTAFSHPVGRVCFSALHFVFDRKRRGRPKRARAKRRMSNGNLDKNSKATIAAAEGESLLAQGDTMKAKWKFVEAGQILENEANDRSGKADRSIGFFLAATQFFKGGEYQRAKETSARVVTEDLSDRMRREFRRFRTEVASRCVDGYSSTLRNRLRKLYKQERFDDILALLRKHPYAVHPVHLALMRGICRESMKDFKVAALFFSDAVRFGGGTEIYFAASVPTYKLSKSGHLDEAWECASFLIKELPHPITYISASMVQFHLAHRATSVEEKLPHIKAQLELMDQAWRSLHDARISLDGDLRTLFSMGLDAAALNSLHLERDKTVELCNRAIQVAPDSPMPWQIRGFVRGPSEAAERDFKAAAALDPSDYRPYYYLAHSSLLGNRFQECAGYCDSALQLHPSRHNRSQLTNWKAICMEMLGAPSEEVGELFRAATQIDPDNPDAAFNYRHFLEKHSGRHYRALEVGDWKIETPQEPDLGARIKQQHPGGLGQRRVLREVLAAVS